MPPGRDRKLDEEIDRNLKRAFQELVDEPVPKRLKDLLKRLQETEDTRGAQEGNDGKG